MFICIDMLYRGAFIVTLLPVQLKTVLVPLVVDADWCLVRSSIASLSPFRPLDAPRYALRDCVAYLPLNKLFAKSSVVLS